MAPPAVAQNQGIGDVSQAFGDRFEHDGESPRYRIEVLAFAHNGFDPDEEIFPDEPFETWLDARPPTFLTLPSPRPPGVFAPMVSPGVGQPASGEPGDTAIAAATPQPPGAATIPDENRRPEANLENPVDGTGVGTGIDQPGERDFAPDGSPVIDPDNGPDGGPDGDPGSDPAADPAFNSAGTPVDGSDGEPPPEPAGPLGPADDEALHFLLGSSTATNDAEIPGGEQLRMRSAYGQRLLASLHVLEDPSAVPIIYDPIPEVPPLPGLDSPGSAPSDDNATGSGPLIDDVTGSGPLDDAVGTGPGGSDATGSSPLGGDETGSGEISADEPEAVAEGPPPAFRMLRADELELRDALQRLQRGGEYTPLAHGGWVQPAYPPERAIPVDISLVGTVNPVGTVQLHLSRFLHVTADLVYRAPPASPPPQATETTDGTLSDLKLPLRYALRTQRRVRSGEVHYLDHPAIGLLVVVRPQPVEADENDSLSAPQGPAA